MPCAREGRRDTMVSARGPSLGSPRAGPLWHPGDVTLSSCPLGAGSALSSPVPIVVLCCFLGGARSPPVSPLERGRCCLGLGTGKRSWG